MPSSGVDVLELKGRVKTLQTMSSEKDISEMLIWLKKNVVATEPLLRETRAGLAVGKLRTHASKSVSDLAKELVKKWKGEVDSAKAGKANGNKSSESGTPQPRPTVDTSARASYNVQSPATTIASPTTPASTNGTGAGRSAKADGVKLNIHNDSVRDKCITLLYDALCIDSSASSAHIQRVAVAIEAESCVQFGTSTNAYRAKLRSLYLNLKDKANPRLRQDVLNGVIPAEKLPTMSSKDMASEQRKQEDKKLSEANFHQALGSEELAAETDAFQCSRCKQRKTRYYQQQTRSADEPMTTFVTCTHCGHKWKFS